jgi:hypothetical protein
VSTADVTNDGDKVVVRVTNPADPVFGVLKAEKTITIKK